MDCVTAVSEASQLAAWRYQEFKNIQNRKPVSSSKLNGAIDNGAKTRSLFIVGALYETPASEMLIAFAQHLIVC